MSKWTDITQEILDAIDIIAEYESFGVKFSGGVRANGCASCYAIDREDKNPSAYVLVHGAGRGNYYDSGSTAERIRFFEFAAQHGNHTDWKAARKHYAKRENLWRKLPKSKEDPLNEEKMVFQEWPTHQFALMTRKLIERYPGITVESLTANSTTTPGHVTVASYPRGSQEPSYCVCLPAYGPGLHAAGPTGYVLMRTNGTLLPLYHGPDAPPSMEKRITLGTGMVGRDAIMRLEGTGEEGEVPAPERVKLVSKMEGITDMLVMHSLIPENERPFHLVLTNACGAGEVTAPDKFAPALAGLNVAIVHDADQPGQNGAEVWVKKLSGVCNTVRNVQLPFEITENHGLDFRDWILDKPSGNLG